MREWQNRRVNKEGGRRWFKGFGAIFKFLPKFKASPFNPIMVIQISVSISLNFEIHAPIMRGVAVLEFVLRFKPSSFNLIIVISNFYFN